MLEQAVIEIEGGEKHMVPELEITKISDGLGFGSGTISRRQLEAEVGSEVFGLAEAAIMSQDILVPIGEANGETIEDDGCGDGREVAVVFQGSEIKEHSLNRYKVFGGGVAMTGATRIGLGLARGRTLKENFFDSMDQMDEAEMDYGAHTADHVADENDSGCGALDRAPEIIAYVADNPETIRGGLEALGADLTDFDDVMDEFTAYAAAITGQPYSGRKVVDEITRRGKVVKRLLGKHREGDLVISQVPGYTVNQAVPRKATGGKLDVFVTDEPRLLELADQYAKPQLKELAPQLTDVQKRRRALLSEQIYTLAVSAVLTPGDQRIYLVRARQA